MPEDWDVFLRRIDGHPAMIFADLVAGEAGPDTARPFALRLAFALQQPGDDGLGTEEESQTLYDLEDELFKALCVGNLQSRYVGRITSCGLREAYYYTATETEPVTAARSVFERFASYPPDIHIGSDPEWKLYQELLAPEPFERRTIENRRLIDTLHEHGDDPHIPRAVNHYAYFPTPERRAKFIAQVVNEGFDIEELEPTAKSHPERPYGVELVRPERVSLDWIDALTADLFFRADSCGGRYDGWGTTVCR
jgi:regulator of RNase E activity RraB